MKRLFLAAAALLLLCCGLNAQIPSDFGPTETFLFAQRDTCDLYLDFYKAADGEGKVTVLFAFGGAFKEGERDARTYRSWFWQMTRAGYNVASIDYRLGLKGVQGVGVNLKFIETFKKAVDIAVEDMFSATAYLIENSEELGIDPGLIVTSGSSAGAITALQAEWYLCNGGPGSQILPEGFDYAGVLSFAGAILSLEGNIKYDRKPCPTAFFHGTADSLVPYRQMSFMKYRFAGADALGKTFIKEKYDYNIFRFEGRAHEISISMSYDMPFIIKFLEQNVRAKSGYLIDATIDDPSIPTPSWARNTTI